MTECDKNVFNYMYLSLFYLFVNSLTQNKLYWIVVFKIYDLGCRAMPCMYGKCTEVGSDDYTCSCESGFSGKHCDTYSGR